MSVNCIGDNLFTCQSLVYRVNWLRAKARKERWEEEIELVRCEMDWTVNCFQHHERIWRERAEGADGPGHRAYAWKQWAMWNEWVGMAETRFNVLKEIE